MRVLCVAVLALLLIASLASPIKLPIDRHMRTDMTKVKLMQVDLLNFLALFALMSCLRGPFRFSISILSPLTSQDGKMDWPVFDLDRIVEAKASGVPAVPVTNFYDVGCALLSSLFFLRLIIVISPRLVLVLRSNLSLSSLILDLRTSLLLSAFFAFLNVQKLVGSRCQMHRPGLCQPQQIVRHLVIVHRLSRLLVLISPPLSDAKKSSTYVAYVLRQSRNHA